MSTTQIVRWKLVKIEHENLEVFAQEELNRRWIEKKEYYKTHLEALCDQDRLYDEFVKVWDDLFQFMEKSTTDDYDDIFFWRKNADGTIEIIAQFYNWWMSSQEAISECINNL